MSLQSLRFFTLCQPIKWLHIVKVCIFVLYYRVVQKTDTQFYFWDNFGNSAPILTIFSL